MNKIFGKTGRALMLVLGLFLFAFLLFSSGAKEVFDKLTLSFWGVLGIAFFHALPVLLCAMAWQMIIPPKKRLSLFKMIQARWVGESINTLFPAAQVGGSLVKARLTRQWGMEGPTAVAGAVAELTLNVGTQALFAVMGALLLAQRAEGMLLWGALAGSGLLCLGVTGFLYAQKAGLVSGAGKLAARLSKNMKEKAVDGAAKDADLALKALYRRRWALAGGGFMRLLGWIAGVGEVWLALTLFGHSPSFLDAFLLESLAQAIRAFSFLVPGALGLQEGGLVLLGRAVGLGPETCLALSLVKRAREFILGVPGLLAWQAFEGRHLMRFRRKTKAVKKN